MATCLQFKSSGTDGQGNPVYRYNDFISPLDGCGIANTNEYVVMDGLEYAELSAISNIAELYETYFAFDKDLFVEIHGWLLLTFVVGYGVGKVVNILNISNR
jgi:hypothetical protein